VSGREWKPGDVALCTLDGTFVLKVDSPGRKRWAVSEGNVVTIEDDDLHPLVVIDPEDREQVERLAEALNKSLDFRDGSLLAGAINAALADTLHALANPTPPKPAEPTGLGAVVECIDGRVFVVDHVHGDGTPRWYGPTRSDGAYGRPAWVDIPAVRVLSEGVAS